MSLPLKNGLCKTSWNMLNRTAISVLITRSFSFHKLDCDSYLMEQTKPAPKLTLFTQRVL